LPKLVREGFSGPIYCTSATAQIAKIIMMDSARLQAEDVEFKRRRHQKEGRTGPYPVVPLYTTSDVERVVPLFSPVRYDQVITPIPGLEARLLEAGHVLGSAVVEFSVQVDGQRRKVVFSGDIGRPDRPIIRDPAVIRQADYIVMESTYGDRVHMEPKDIGTQIAEVINTTKKAGGNIVVPSFALERSQEVLYYIHELLKADAIPHIFVFLDSPMAAEIVEVFRRHRELFDEQATELVRRYGCILEFPGLKVTATADESKAINHIKGTVMIIAGSGMCTGGRVKHHLVNNISRPESTIMFVGYQAVGTLGRQIVDGKPEVRILGQMRPVRARIVQIQGFSGHADMNELVAWLDGLAGPPRRIFIVHGEPEGSGHLARFIAEKKGWNTYVPQYLEEVALD
jgi:metallo-beta-lactamase family protein